MCPLFSTRRLRKAANPIELCEDFVFLSLLCARPVSLMVWKVIRSDSGAANANFIIWESDVVEEIPKSSYENKCTNSSLLVGELQFVSAPRFNRVYELERWGRMIARKVEYNLVVFENTCGSIEKLNDGKWIVQILWFITYYEPYSICTWPLGQKWVFICEEKFANEKSWWKKFASI